MCHATKLTRAAKAAYDEYHRYMVARHRPCPDWLSLSQSERTSALKLIALLLVPNNDLKRAHEQWVNYLIEMGWTPAPEIDAVSRGHFCICALEELTEEAWMFLTFFNGAALGVSLNVTLAGLCPAQLAASTA